MTYYDDIYYDSITPNYMNLIVDELIDKNIIFLHQYIRDIDNDFDREYGPINSWIIGIIFIEKTATDYIFHMLETDKKSSGAEPHYIERFITFPHKQTVKLSEMKSQNRNLFKLYYITAKESNDKILINEIEKLNNFYLL